jgi:hypothetical protein
MLIVTTCALSNGGWDEYEGILHWKMIEAPLVFKNIQACKFWMWLFDAGHNNGYSVGYSIGSLQRKKTKKIISKTQR